MLMNGLPKITGLSPWNLEMLYGKGTLADVIKLRILRWRAYPELSGWSLSATMCVLIRGSQRELSH